MRSKRAAVELALWLVACCVAGFAVSDAGAADKLAGKLFVQDGLTMPGKPVMIEARLLQDGLLRQSGIGGEVVEFSLMGKKIGTSLTGGDGRALVEQTPHMRGNHPITAHVVESKRVQAAEATGTLFVWERRRPLLLIELAALVEPSPGPLLPSLPSGPKVQLTPLPDAADELKRLTDFFFNAVYVSRTGHHGIGKQAELREWLRAQRFPAGVVMTIDPGKAALAAMIEHMREQGWDHLKSGVGRSREFAEVLVEQRIAVVIVPEPERGEAPKKAQTAQGWKEVRKKIQG